ncbi:hypothetical protein [Flavobacterium sp. KACC 22761]|uniref:hypothetical protein n=1 Tax=Flavobacterium sp. KACC 22761 TaxID=3092665 RepID=UPI002A74892D|nr:hypothetical protein [Flavobacterium sp. KACC 22761]WPO77346.1 hypothetical protein SCB73_13840 [Flavobacterium sp. KACC 22761]
MKNITFILLITIAFYSCDNETTPPKATYINTCINIDLKDNKSGENLLGTEKFPENIIYADYLIAGKKVLNISNAITSDYPNNVHVVNEFDRHYIKVFLNAIENEDFPITYLHWNKTETDTIKAKYDRENGKFGISVTLEKVWINNVLVWEVTKQGQTNSDITIYK